MAFGRLLSFTSACALAALASPQAGWPTHGGNAAHTALSTGVSAQAMSRVLWSAPLDLAPQYNGDILYAHYGSPVATANDVLVIPVKTGATSGFRVVARTASTGALLWQQATDYVVPSHNWYPTMGPTLVGNVAAYPRKAGLVGYRSLDKAANSGRNPVASASACFYGLANYNANPAVYDAAVRISSPLVTADDGSIVFTYRVEGDTPLGLKGGLAVIRPDGSVGYVEGAVATGNASFYRPKLNAAPAVANGVAYAVIKDGGSAGKIVAIRLSTLTTLYKADLIDPKNGGSSYVDDEGTSCPMVGPDGDVYFGVLESPFGSHHYRGWLLHFDATLAQRKTPSSFGWDDTPSVVPSGIVAGYSGTSSYLVMTKYNNYAFAGGDGSNRIAILDPNASANDPFSGVATMKEVVTQLGITPDPGATGSYPSAVREWCINSAVVDVAGRSILVNSEDGYVYRWNLATNTLDQRMRITSGIGQAYTPVMLSSTGVVYAISNATLYALGR